MSNDERPSTREILRRTRPWWLVPLIAIFGFALVLARAGDLPAGDEEARRAVSLHGPIIHSVHLVLVDGEMRVRGYYDSNEPEALERLSGDIGRLLAGT